MMAKLPNKSPKRPGSLVRWTTATILVLCLTVLTLLINISWFSARAANCYPSQGYDAAQAVKDRCYSDIPYIYTVRGLQADLYPYDDSSPLRKSFPAGGPQDGAMEYPPIISYFAYGVARLTNHGSTPPARIYNTVPSGTAAGLYAFSEYPQIAVNTHNFYMGNVLILAMAAMLLVLLLYLLLPHRRDLLWLTASPLLGATAFINWDLLAVLFATASFLAWRRNKVVLTGVLLGLGGATKLYPLVLAAAALYLLLNRREFRAALRLSLATAGSFLLATLPALLTGLPEWKYFWSFNEHRAPDFGSLWLAGDLLSHGRFAVSVATANGAGYAILGGAYLALFLVLRKAKRTPTYAELGILLLLPFLLTQKVFSPQYALWLFPLVLLAGLPWWGKLLWQLTEGLYFWVVWEFVHQDGAISAHYMGVSNLYGGTIVVRALGELLLGALVLFQLFRQNSSAEDSLAKPTEEEANV